MFIQKLWSKINTVVPFQSPICESKLNEFVHFKERLAHFACHKRLKINMSMFAVAKLQVHNVVVKIFHIYHTK